PRGVHAEARAPQRHPGLRALRRLRTHALADRRRRVLSRDYIAANIGRTAQGVAEDAEWSAVADAAVPGAERRVDIRVRSSRRGDGPRLRVMPVAKRRSLLAEAVHHLVRLVADRVVEDGFGVIVL